MTAMVERVAKELARQRGISLGIEVTVEGKRRVLEPWRELMPQVCAAIVVMREPTEAMLNAARDWSAKKYGKPIGNDAAIGCWQAMLDEALK